MKDLLFLIIFFIIFTGCQKPIDIDISKNIPKLVVNGLFTPDSIFKINISSSTYYNDIEYNLINDADAILFENDILIDTFRNIRNGNYVIDDFYPKMHKLYKIKVEKEGFETVYAEDSIPEKVIPIEFYKTDNVLIDDEGFYFSSFIISFYDIVNSDYYKLYISTNFNQEFFYGTAIQSDNIIIQSEIGNNFFTDGAFFSDILFENSEINLDFLFTAWSTKPFDASYNLRFIFQTLSENYYKFSKSQYMYMYQKRINEYYLISSDPVQLYTNIENGFGIFAGYNIYVDSI